MATNPNMVAIQTVTVGAGGASSITFSSIPATYTDLVLKWSGRSASGSNTLDNLNITFNGSTTGYSQRLLFTTNGTSAASDQNSSYNFNYVTGGGATANTFSNCEIYIPNYAGSTNKSYSADMVTENNATAAGVLMNATLWANTSAINQITLQIVGYNFAQYSTATLYGVTSAGYGAKATGGIITQDANYFYHTFLSSGTFTPTQSLTADVLTIAGGGAGGPVYNFSVGGGGGAGGYKLQLAQSLTAINYTCTVGAGGAGGASAGANGSNSSFGSVSGTIDGGGGGGSNASSGGTRSGANGGSGGGAGGGGVSTFSGGTATSGQGSNGGAYNGSGNEGAGGGGFSAVGSTNTGGTAGRGGNGAGGTGYADYLVLNSIGAACGIGQLSGGNYYFAGGGSSIGGGQALGGGGVGGGYDTTTFNNPGSAGTANTGGGGGTWGYAGSSGPATKIGYNGGSGVIVVRYAK